jgi:ribose 1,5-bisphosphokinase PhnN
MALKSKKSPAGAKRSGKKAALSSAGKITHAGVLATRKLIKGRRTATDETIEARLARKATVADKKTFVTMSLGQMTREKRHKLLYGD